MPPEKKSLAIDKTKWQKICFFRYRKGANNIIAAKKLLL